MAYRGDHRAQLYFAYYAERVARGLGVLASAVPVDFIIISGGVASAGPHFRKALVERLGRGDLLDVTVASTIDVVFCPESSPARGAALYADDQNNSERNSQ